MLDPSPRIIYARLTERDRNEVARRHFRAVLTQHALRNGRTFTVCGGAK